MSAPGDKALKRAVASVFTHTSETHDTVGPPIFAHFGELLVDRLELNPGERVLDIAAGAGAAVFPAAQAVGARGRVVGVDIAGGMVDRLNSEISRRGLTNAEGLVGDAEDLPFTDRSFDAVMCAFGLFFFPNWKRALDEFHRVLRPGGSLAVSTFTKTGSDSLERIRQLLYAVVPRPPSDVLLPAFDDPRSLNEALEEAGFVAVEVHESAYEAVFANFNEWLVWMSTMEFREDLEGMEADTLARFRELAVVELAGGHDEREISFPMDALLTRAERSR